MKEPPKLERQYFTPDCFRTSFIKLLELNKNSKLTVAEIGLWEGENAKRMGL